MVLDYVRERKIKVIHMTRDNSLHVLASRYRKKLTHIAHTHEKPPAVKFRLPTNNLLNELDRLEREKATWETTLAGLLCLDVSYESFADNMTSAAPRILEYLGVDPDYRLHSPLVKINPDSLTDVLENYDDVEAVLRGTSYEKFLD